MYDISEIKRHLIGEKVYFGIKTTNGTIIIGHRKLEDIVLGKDGFLYRINHYNNSKVEDVFETKEELFAYLSDKL